MKIKTQNWNVNFLYAPGCLCCVYINPIFIPSENHFWWTLGFARQNKFGILTHSRLVVDTHRLQERGEWKKKKSKKRRTHARTQASATNKYVFFCVFTLTAFMLTYDLPLFVVLPPVWNQTAPDSMKYFPAVLSPPFCVRHHECGCYLVSHRKNGMLCPHLCS